MALVILLPVSLIKENLRGVRKFATQNPNLRWHKKNMHERVKCEVCGQEICNGFMLKRHKASVHGIIPTDAYQCEHCPMFFMKLQAKEKHIEKNHKNETSSIK